MKRATIEGDKQAGGILDSRKSDRVAPLTARRGGDLPVFRPSLPTAEELRPYLERIDASHWYSNQGPLTREFEARLAALFGVPEGCVVTSCNGTAALVQALRAAGARQGSLCLAPSWTFAATPAAITAAGLTPYFVDVDPETWRLEPESAEALVGKLDVGAVMPVSPFGAPVDCAAWDAFHRRTGVPPVIDAAAAFDTYTRSGHPPIGAAPVMVSLHATKVFGVGEGAVLVTEDADLAHTLRLHGNFGFYASRLAAVPGVNAKLSEYACAVGLAGLDGWARVRPEWLALGALFRAEAAETESVRPGPGLEGDWVSSYGLITLPDGAPAVEVAGRLAAEGIDTRLWWEGGCHVQPAYRNCPRGDLPNTEVLARQVIGLPFWRGMTRDDVGRVFIALRAALRDLST